LPAGSSTAAANALRTGRVLRPGRLMHTKTRLAGYLQQCRGSRGSEPLTGLVAFNALKVTSPTAQSNLPKESCLTRHRALEAVVWWFLGWQQSAPCG
jgi:hypothetical protein